MTVWLPACGQWKERFHLSAAQKRELIERIAAHGPAAIDEYVAAMAGTDATIAAKIQAAREELMARAAKLKEALEQQFAERRKEVEARLDAREADLHGQREAVEQRLGTFRLERDAQLTDALRNSQLVRLTLDQPPAPLTAWRRFMAFLRRLWLALLTLLGLRKRRTSKRRPLLATLPGIGRLGIETTDLEAALHSDGMRQRVRERLRGMSGAERAKRLWERMLGREDYESLAMRLMEEELRRELERKEAELQARERDMGEQLAKLAEEERHAIDEEREALERLARERAEALRKLEEEAERKPMRDLREELEEELRILGYLESASEGGDLTRKLIDRFSELVYESEMKALGSSHRASYGSYIEGEGVFRKEPMLSVDELSHMDILGSVVQARMRHPHQRHIYDDDVLVYREMRVSTTHVVLIVDTSGSMEENERIGAAKRAALALYQAAKRDNKANQVDLVMMETSVRKGDILDAWRAEPRGFTNTGGALALTRVILEKSRADRRLVYLITDGLPEAMTLPDGTDIASYPDRCLDYALGEVRKLKKVPGLGFAVLLLEPKDRMYVKAAERIAAEVEGKVMPTDPTELVKKVLVDFDAAKRPRLAPAQLR